MTESLSVLVLAVNDLYAQDAAEVLQSIANVTRVLNPEHLDELARAGVRFDHVFAPHWRWLISSDLLKRWRVIGFHAAPLPAGRGGSPVQNQILRGLYDSQLCAYEMTTGVDEGPILLREPLDLSTGTAEEIFREISRSTAQMMKRIILDDPPSTPQEGPVSYGTRRHPEDSDIANAGLESARQVFDFIRMLDGLDYPPACMRIPGWRVQFSQAQLEGDQVCAKVVFLKDDK